MLILEHLCFIAQEYKLIMFVFSCRDPWFERLVTGRDAAGPGPADAERVLPAAVPHQ